MVIDYNQIDILPDRSKSILKTQAFTKLLKQSNSKILIINYVKIIVCMLDLKHHS